LCGYYRVVTCHQGPPFATVEYFTPMANKCPKGDRHHQLEGMFKKHVLAEAGSPSSKAATCLLHPAGGNHCLTRGAYRGAYMEYVSTAKWRERRWRLFSTFPLCKQRARPAGRTKQGRGGRSVELGKGNSTRQIIAIFTTLPYLALSLFGTKPLTKGRNVGARPYSCD